MPALYLFFKNGDSLLLGCSDSEGTAGYNAIMENGDGFVDFNSGAQSVRLGVRTTEVAAICYNPQDNDTAFASSAVNNLNYTLERLKAERRQTETKDARTSAQPVPPSPKT